MSGLDLVPTAPVHTEVRGHDFYEALDAGIRFAVRALHAAGIPTCQSCQGGLGHSYDAPTVDMIDGRAFEAMEVLQRYGIDVAQVMSVWRIEKGMPVERVWRVVLCHTVADRVEEAPHMVTGSLHVECWTRTEEDQ